jgi:cellobiose epimerase
MNRKAMLDSINTELQCNLLPFWRERSLDRVGGGFVAEMANNGALNAQAPKGLILNARLLWTFSALYNELADARDRILARRAFDYLSEHFYDRDCGGYCWRVGPDGLVADSSKKIYGQAFCIYALSEYYRAAGSDDILRAAKQVFDRIEQHARDDKHGGYIEALAQDWSPAEDLRLSDKDMDVAKSMNNHLHMLEAYANLFRVWPDEAVAKRLRELIHLFESKMLTPAGHFDLFFDGDWRVRSNSYTYGHDIEGAWLLYDAAEALKDESLKRKASGWALTIARAVGSEALDADGGLAYEGREGLVTNSGREWWPQAEGILGFWCAYRISKENKYADIAERLWAFIQHRVVDKVHGEWFWRVFADGSIDRNEPKISEWKDPYHGIRMCLRMRRFLEGKNATDYADCTDGDHATG